MAGALSARIPSLTVKRLRFLPGSSQSEKESGLGQEVEKTRKLSHSKAFMKLSPVCVETASEKE